MPVQASLPNLAVYRGGAPIRPDVVLAMGAVGRVGAPMNKKVAAQMGRPAGSPSVSLQNGMILNAGSAARQHRGRNDAPCRHPDPGANGPHNGAGYA